AGAALRAREQHPLSVHLGTVAHAAHGWRLPGSRPRRGEGRHTDRARAGLFIAARLAPRADRTQGLGRSPEFTATAVSRVRSAANRRVVDLKIAAYRVSRKRANSNNA